MTQIGEKTKKPLTRDKMKTINVNDIDVLASEELENENIEICKKEENISGTVKSFSTLQHTLPHRNACTEQNGCAKVINTKMAPEKSKAKVIKKSKMEIMLWANCTKSERVPDSYVSIDGAERMFGVKYKDLTAVELMSVIYSRRGGQYGYFLPPKVLDAAKARLKPAIPETWLSEKFLIGCLERKGGGLQKGEMANYRVSWGKKGIQEGKTGGSETWYYPPEFLTKQLGLAIIKNRQSVKFIESRGGGDNIKGLDVTGPPSKPMYFLLNTADMSDIIINSDSSDTEENELNIATIVDPDDVSNTSVDKM